MLALLLSARPSLAAPAARMLRLAAVRRLVVVAPGLRFTRHLASRRLALAGRNARVTPLAAGPAPTYVGRPSPRPRSPDATFEGMAVRPVGKTPTAVPASPGTMVRPVPGALAAADVAAAGKLMAVVPRPPVDGGDAVS